MMRLSTARIICSMKELALIPEGKVLINTINAHSYNMAQKDGLFAETLNAQQSTLCTQHSTLNKYLIPDGTSIVKACRWLKANSQPKERIAGWDLFTFEMKKISNLNPPLGSAPLHSKESSTQKPKVMFVGSSEQVLQKIRQRAAIEYPNLEVLTYSPSYKPVFSDEDNRAIINAINLARPDLLWIGMTAPKQEKWAYLHWHELDIHCHVGTIGAVFDFYAGTVSRAPQWWQDHSLEWLYRLKEEPRRMWRRYVLGIPLFLWYIVQERLSSLVQ